ncbi:MAG TPA: hypothetical protein VGG44_04545 [Tepidisphaeraceae bacterium]|jgi:hypothetical protein
MGMHEGRARLNKSMKELMMHWNETKTQWRDGNARVFESKFLTPMEQDAKRAVSAMDHMAQVLQKIRSDCED